MIGRVLGVSGKKIYRWYKNVLSGFLKEAEQSKLHQHDIVQTDKVNSRTGEISALAVPILKAEHFGEHMTIDDKDIGGDGYTIIANKQTGKIALLAQTTKANLIAEILQKIPVKIRYAVRIISKDLAAGYDWVARTNFSNAVRVADKFHVLKLGFEALQAVRVRYRQLILLEERRKREEKKALDRELKASCQRLGQRYQKPTQPVKPPKMYANGDTKKELLARSRYLLFSFKEKWTESQRERADILWQEFPEIKKAYELMIQFRGFYQTKIGDLKQAKNRLRNWYEQVSAAQIEDLETFAATVAHHEGEILNYFATGCTNAYAEALNAQIQSFIYQNSGTRDRHFFHFRLKGYFS